MSFKNKSKDFTIFWVLLCSRYKYEFFFFIFALFCNESLAYVVNLEFHDQQWSRS